MMAHHIHFFQRLYFVHRPAMWAQRVQLRSMVPMGAAPLVPEGPRPGWPAPSTSCPTAQLQFPFVRKPYVPGIPISLLTPRGHPEKPHWAPARKPRGPLPPCLHAGPVLPSGVSYWTRTRRSPGLEGLVSGQMPTLGHGERAGGCPSPSRAVPTVLRASQGPIESADSDSATAGARTRKLHSEVAATCFIWLRSTTV